MRLVLVCLRLMWRSFSFAPIFDYPTLLKLVVVWEFFYVWKYPLKLTLVTYPPHPAGNQSLVNHLLSVTNASGVDGYVVA